MGNEDRPLRLFAPANSKAIEDAALDVLRSGAIASGHHVARFEEQLSTRVGNWPVATVDDITHALAIALHTAGVGPGDEVLCQPFNCLSSTTAIARLGAKPVWIDMAPETATLRLDDIKKALTPRSKALVVYHVAGYPAPMKEVKAICDDLRLPLIEDCNNALGATLDTRAVGTFGNAACFSFYPNRQINALEGGAVASRSEAAHQRILRLRKFGIQSATFRNSLGEINPASDIPEIGWPANFGNINAAIGLEQFGTLDEHLARTRRHAERLQQACRRSATLTPVIAVPGAEPAYWAFLILSTRRDASLQELKRRDIPATRLHLRNDLYSGFNSAPRDLPGVDRLMSQILAVPCGHWLSDTDIDRLASALSDQ